MSYTWEEYWRSKSDEELYKIYLGYNYSTQSEQLSAENELKRRNFDFKNITKYKEKWELEKLIKEVNDESKGLFSMLFNPPIHDFIGSIIGIFGGCLLLLIIIIELIKSENKLSQDIVELIFGCIAFFLMGIIFFITAKKRKKKISERAKRIEELTSKLIK